MAVNVTAIDRDGSRGQRVRRAELSPGYHSSPRDPAVTGARTHRAWYVVETQRHREAVARAVLAEQGVASYFPRVEQWPRPAVGSAIAPMFPGYLFVHATVEDAPRIVRANGVKAFVTFGGSAVAVGEDVIRFLRGREDADGVIRCAPPDVAGVRIVRGPFRGLTGVLAGRLPARDRVRVLMELLQRQTPVELPEKWVRKL